MNNERNSTKDILDNSNFKLWKQEFYLLLKGKKLEEYILKEKIKKIPENKLSKEQKKRLTLVDGTTDTYYEESVTEDMTQEDSLVKEYLINSISKELAEKFDFITLTAYEIYKLISSLNVNDDNDLIEEIKNSLEKEKYTPGKDASLSIFISNMKTKFRELNVLKASPSEQEKIDYLYNSIPDDLALRSNAINFEGNFDEFSELLIKTNQRLIKLTERRLKSSINNNQSNSSDNLQGVNEDLSKNINTYPNGAKNNENNFESNFNKVHKNNNHKYNKRNYNNKNYQYNHRKQDKSEVECWNCGKKGHYASECRNKNNKNNYRKFNNKEVNKGRHYIKHRS